MRRIPFPAFIFVLILLGGGAMGLGWTRPAQDKTGHPAAGAVFNGAWSQLFEKNFGEVIPLFAPARDTWGRIEYALFRQGRAGVVVGEDGWLFTSEEFSCPADSEETFAAHMKFVGETADTLRQQGSEIVIALIPAKARVFEEKTGALSWPSCRRDVYDRARAAFKAAGIAYASPLAALQAGGAETFLRTDTHWSPAGAARTAEIVADTVKTIKMPLPAAAFDVKTGAAEPHRGDLLRYLPGVAEDGIASDRLATPESVSPAQRSDDLFGDSTAPAAALIGTSYSADPSWGFEAALKKSLGADVINLADEGLGPFSVMKNYLDKKPLTAHPPLLVIWEIPERYLILPEKDFVKE